MRKIDLILNGKYIRRIDAEALLAFLQDEFFGNTDILAGLLLLLNTDAADRFRVMASALPSRMGTSKLSSSM